MVQKSKRKYRLIIRPSTYHQCDLKQRRFLVFKVMEQDIGAIVEDIEAEQARGRVSAMQVFKSMINQPALVSISSANANSVASLNGYSSFTVDMPRPILQSKTMQLLDAVIPLPTTCIPDTACAFWYYRLSAYSGLAPNTDNLYFNRLLPSYYKPDNIASPSNYGWNKTFTSYADASTQTALAGTTDLALVNQTAIIGQLTDYADYSFYNIKYIPNDVSIAYNSNYNKFQMTGSNVSTPFATTAWASSNTYALGDVVYFFDTNTNPQTGIYQSIQASNTNHAPVDTTPVPPVLNSAWWKQIYSEIVKPYNRDTIYRKGSLVYGTQSPYINVYRANWDIHDSGGPLGVTVTRTWDITRQYWFNDWVTRGIVSYICFQPNVAVAPDGVIGSQYWVSDTWSSSTTYPQGIYIFYTPGNSWYKSLIPNNLNQTPTNTNAWEKLGSTAWTLYTPTAQSPNYRYLATGYNDPNVVLNQGTGQRQWSPYALYEAGAIVQKDGFDYTAALQSRNIPPFQLQLNTTTWSATRRYAIGQTVLYTPQGGTQSVFICIAANTGQYPSILSQFWSPMTGFWSTTTTQWSSTSSYSTGNTVAFGGKYYKALQNSTNLQPSLNPLYWQVKAWITGAAPIVGLNAVSSALDMVEIYVDGGFQYVDSPFPEGIPGQPFNPSPRRILNSILGFTWNGQIPDPAILDVIVKYDPLIYGTTALIGNTGVTLYNRLRPIPPYVVETGLTGELLGVTARPSTTSATYTAEGYANLVYTSIVSVYTTIVGGSTLNTQRSTNLLAIVGMNAGNLGVAYYKNYIDDALKMNDSDIYSIGIELRDEMDEPYYLTNNAVCSLTMKFTYKD